MTADEAVGLALDLIKDEFPDVDTASVRQVISDLAYENMRLATVDDAEQRKQIEFNISTLETLLVIEDALVKAQLINFSKKVAMKALSLFITTVLF